MAENPRKPWYSYIWSSISFHVLAWMLVFFLPLLFAGMNNHAPPVDVGRALFNTGHIGFMTASLLLFYSNAFYFIPHFLNRGKKWQYGLLQLLLFAGLLASAIFLFPPPDKGPSHMGFHREYLFLFVPFLILWSTSTVYRFSSDKAKTDQLLKEKENENLKTELLFLRSQVSPHFLFNVLNNMVALARLKSDRLEASLIKLSGLMRYMLYESDEQRVPLAKEIEYVTSYIDLQRLRFGEDMRISLKIAELPGDYLLIEPMLLIPFIENAFKHGTGLIKNPEIDIALQVNGGQLDFSVRNKYNGEGSEVKDKTSGIGLANVVRRLNLLYGNAHSLTIDKQDGWYVVTLQLKLEY
jgi:two-component system LytT family sensor kinase